MLNPIRLVNDLFNDEKLFDPELRPFTEDHLARLALPVNNPGGVYNTLLSNTTTKYTNYFGKITDELTKKAISEELTINMNNARTATEEKISQLQGLVKFKFGETSAVYQAFYPLGMAEYYQAKIGEIYPLFLRFVNAATANLNADYPAEVTAISGLVSNFQAARSAQETMFGEVDSISTGKHADRKILTVQLTVNFLSIALNNIDNPDKFDDYYDPRYLPITREADEPVSKEGTVNMGMIANIDISDITGGGPTTKLKLYNPGSSKLQYYFSNAAGGPPSGVTVEVEPGAQAVKTAAEMNAGSGNDFLNVQNIGAANGNYKVEIFV